jgi:hypothetical protein
MKIVKFVGTRLPETGDAKERREFKNGLVSHPYEWAQADLTGRAVSFFYNGVQLNKDTDFPATEFEVKIVDGVLFVRYAPNRNPVEGPRNYGPDGIENHGHVWPRSDGRKARCGGSSMCTVCKEHARLVN